MKWVKIVLGTIIILIAIGIVTGEGIMPNQNETGNSSNYVATNTDEDKKIDIEKLILSDTDIELDIKDTKNILVNIQPSKADTENLEFYSTNAQIVKFSKDTIKSNETEIYGKLQPISEGECEIYVRSNEIESNKVKVTVIDKERIENEKKLKEEQAKKEAEEAKRLAEEQAKKQAQAQAQTQYQPPKQETTTTQPSTPNNNNSRTVYITPTGKRYHYSSTCGGKNSRSTTLSNAISLGLTPCQKCAQ